MKIVRRCAGATNILGMVAALVVFSTNAAQAGQSSVTGVVCDVNINTTWAGVMVEMSTSQSFCANNGAFLAFETGTGLVCSGAAFAYMSVNDPLFRPTVASLMAARLSGMVITVTTAGCVQAPLGPMPQIAVIEFGTRVPNT
jgi:hypothetical protein